MTEQKKDGVMWSIIPTGTFRDAGSALCSKDALYFNGLAEESLHAEQRHGQEVNVIGSD